MNTYIFVNIKNKNEICIESKDLMCALDVLELNYENSDEYLCEFDKTRYNGQLVKSQVGVRPENINIPRYPLVTLTKMEKINDQFTLGEQVNTANYDAIYN